MVLTVSLSTYTVASAEVIETTANNIMPGCRLMIQPGGNSQGRTDAFDKGVCTGALIATSDNGSDICPPNGANLTQAIRIVVQYIDGRPSRLHEKFSPLAAEALRSAWPCKR
jgi:hypothetical protein